MGKIELSLRSNINLLTAAGMFGFKVPTAELDYIVHRISKNFHAPNSTALATTALSLWITSKDRAHAHQILTVAHDIETEWREKNSIRSFIHIASNPYGYDVVSLAEINNLPKPAKESLKAQLKVLKDEDFFKTPYWRCVNTAALQLYGFECQVRIQGTQCGSSRDVEAVYVNLESERGEEHVTFRNDTAIMCEECRIRTGMQVGPGVTHSHRVEVKKSYGSEK